MNMKNFLKILFIILLFNSCQEEVLEFKAGCTEVGSCNYDPEATFNDGTCDKITCADCAGEPNGNAQIDDCEICHGDNTYCIPINLYFGDINLINEENSTYIIEVLINSSHDLTAFQFDLNGGEILGASGGLAEEYGFRIELNDANPDETILGFSMNDNKIPPVSNDVLINITFNAISDEICLNLGSGSFVEIIQGIPTFEDLNFNFNLDEGEECFYDDTNHDCEGIQLILSNWNDLVNIYGFEQTLYELYDRLDEFDDSIINYTINFDECKQITEGD